MSENLTGDPRDEDAWMWSVAEIQADPYGTLQYIRRLEAQLRRALAYGVRALQPPSHPVNGIDSK